MRRVFILISVIVTLGPLLATAAWPYAGLGFIIVLPIIMLGVYDMLQSKRAIRRNFPVIGHFRYLFEAIRPEINQYFVESDTDGVPFSRVIRSLVYQRAKQVSDTVPFGTKLDVYAPGYRWANHSLAPTHVDSAELRVSVGGPQCDKPYSASIFNISAMSFGALSHSAISALNGGAKRGHFAHDTGEGGLTPYHLGPGGDIIWEIGTGYFSCRTKDGHFDPVQFREKATHPHVKMVEIKLSQGAKPGHGGILPAAKVTHEIAAIRGVEFGKDVISPPGHSAFSTPLEMMKFVQKIRELSGGKPAGFKLCLGKRREFIAICKAMQVSKIMPDFIVIDGGEGGTGAAPLEFTNYIGSPLNDALVFVHNCLGGFDLRKHIRLIVSGKIVSAFDIVERCALGADMSNSARGMMMALGCIQALRCNTNACPTGVATQDPQLVRGLVVADKATRVFNYHQQTVASVAEIIGAMGIAHTRELRPWHIMVRQTAHLTQHFGEIFPYLKPGALLEKTIHPAYARAFAAAQAGSWGAQEEIEYAA